MATDIQEIISEDIEYLRHGDRSMILRLSRPAGTGPFPIIVDLHGGAWCNGGIDECQARDEILVDSGFATAALEFRDAGDGYPTSLIDINYAVRWLKTEAGNLRLDPERIGLAGQSSGGHLAMLAAMRPHDPRYASITLGAGSPDDWRGEFAFWKNAGITHITAHTTYAAGRHKRIEGRTVADHITAARSFMEAVKDLK